MFGRKPRVLVRQHHNRKQFEKDANKPLKDGYRVVQLTEEKVGRGLLTQALTYHITVTYQKD